MSGAYDVLVVGAGPSGSTFARLAGKLGLRVLLLGGGRRPKPCGGLLAPDAQKALARYRLTLPKDVMVDPQIFAVRTIDVKTGLERYYQRMYINLARDRFDHWLRSLAGEHAEVSPLSCLSVKRDGNAFAAALSDGGSVAAGCVVGADGAGSLVARSFFPKLDTRVYTAIQQWFPAGKTDPFYSCVFDPEVSDCYSWSTFKDRHFIFGGAFAAKGSRESFEKQKRKLLDFGFSFGEPERTEACLVLRPKGLHSFRCGGDGVFLIGEAAGFISPSSLEGISSAILSADALAAAFASGKDPLREYERRTLPLRVKLACKNLKCPFMYEPRIRRLVMASGVASIDVR